MKRNGQEAIRYRGVGVVSHPQPQRQIGKGDVGMPNDNGKLSNQNPIDASQREQSLDPFVTRTSTDPRKPMIVYRGNILLPF